MRTHKKRSERFRARASELTEHTHDAGIHFEPREFYSLANRSEFIEEMTGIRHENEMLDQHTLRKMLALSIVEPSQTDLLPTSEEWNMINVMIPRERKRNIRDKRSGSYEIQAATTLALADPTRLKDIRLNPDAFERTYAYFSNYLQQHNEILPRVLYPLLEGIAIFHPEKKAALQIPQVEQWVRALAKHYCETDESRKIDYTATAMQRLGGRLIFPELRGVLCPPDFLAGAIEHLDDPDEYRIPLLAALKLLTADHVEMASSGLRAWNDEEADSPNTLPSRSPL
ncbi:MAG: hypothetical protein COW24_04590 [Candidatus Kerfeldbacteria bacterium CG15_BIG_FIL_POST_REV_8_21_14_020_45_12]|uniref:Uncharacterized protein n=1 Tax=Candidatus Kerfeldbacteria bacterium CG15_BIG_FIL_POST_REV_8_21_14_020_45_12 TaxID=2014247 RepID=A0A2M7H2Z3_9BACT|nr:MAG: hypothetical protein COW24_04590 [Candidatus Kerfeldbacteria bacterium CG15_BIG_FIL_POST_REV_8_21_14_020_45_12]PJA93369.1 MAG: hypothetical protein CO132_03365 [Candidatus Kerfeldbacteria bacterium CG_4_9_14_3_um_filter_45_8]